MKSLYLKSTGCVNKSFRLFTKKAHGNHDETPFGDGTLTANGGVSVKVQGETLTFASPMAAIKRATEEGFAIVGA